MRFGYGKWRENIQNFDSFHKVYFGDTDQLYFILSKRLTFSDLKKCIFLTERNHEHANERKNNVGGSKDQCTHHSVSEQHSIKNDTQV